MLSELKLKGIRSSGPGGQNVNKVATKIELTFDLNNSSGLSESEITRLKTTVKHRLTKENILILHCDENRSQHKNKNIILKRFLDILIEGIKRPKARKTSRPSRGSILKRLDTKKIQSQKKENRKKTKY